MNRAIIEPLIGQLDWLIGALSHATITSGSGGRTAKEREACDLLREARRKLIEELNRLRELFEDLHRYPPTEEGKPV